MSKEAGMIIRNKRKECGMTLEEVGSAIGCQKSAVSKIERGDCVPAPERLSALSSALQFSEREYLRLLLAYAPYRTEAIL